MVEIDCSPVLDSLLGCGVGEFVSLVDQAGVLKIELERQDGCVVSTCFDTCLSYRKYDEGDALIFLDEMGGKNFLGHPFYLVKDSEYLQWFLAQSYGIKRIEDVIGYVFLTLNDVIEVICCTEPIMSLVPEASGD